MESRSAAGARRAEVVVSGPGGAGTASVVLSGDRATVGRLEGVNDIVLQPDPQFLITRAGHCALEREGVRWFLVDGGSVNGTFLRRSGALQRVTERTPLHDGDVICVLAARGRRALSCREIAQPLAGLRASTTSPSNRTLSS